MTRNHEFRNTRRTYRRISQILLQQIEATVSEFLGRGRVKDKGRKPAFSRHASIYHARPVGGWSCRKISRFYNAAITRSCSRRLARSRDFGSSKNLFMRLWTVDVRARLGNASGRDLESKWWRLTGIRSRNESTRHIRIC